MADSKGGVGFDELYRLAGGASTGIGALETLARERRRGSWEGFGMAIGGTPKAATTAASASVQAARSDAAMRVSQGVKLLKSLASSDRRTARALAEANGLSPRLAAELIQSAVNAGFVALERTASGTFVSLTEAGRSQIESI